MFYETIQNRYGHRALFRCYRTECGGYIACFVRWIANARQDTE